MSKKWIKGERITDPEAAIRLILAGDVIFENDKPQNSGWTQNWSISQIRAATWGGRLFFALPAETTEKGQAA